MEQQHKHADGVLTLRGNVFFFCPSCMKNKLCTKCTGKHTHLGSCRNCAHNSSQEKNTHTTTTANSDDSLSNTEDDWDEYLDDIHLPEALPGQHFHVDFGFVRGSEFKVPTGKKGEGPTLTSIDAKNSYCIIVDRAIRYLWVHSDHTKQPPVDPVQMVLQKFGEKQTTHRTVCTDQDKGLGRSKEFVKMVNDEDFTIELTGTDSSKQNSIAEQQLEHLCEHNFGVLVGLGIRYWRWGSHDITWIPPDLSMSRSQSFSGK